jgi:hypothetical protein
MNDPALQLVHVLANNPENLPGMHASHFEDPVLLLNLPA